MILSWDNPRKAMPVEDWKGISFDGGPPGGYVPNVHPDDASKWRAVLTGTRTSPNPRCFYCERGHRNGDVCTGCHNLWKPLGLRVEIRTQVWGVQILIVVHHDDAVKMSMNGKAIFEDSRDIVTMMIAIEEAKLAIVNHRKKVT